MRPSLCHVALNVHNLEACERFYVDLLGMTVEWRPDADNVYLTGGRDNLALHRAPVSGSGQQRLGVRIAAAPRTHRDGARSFYVQDPDGNSVQMIYHPPLAGVL
jgi:catechol 2,3-dioxygenase-like lactoylglutathione lyase family enzyme